MAYSLYGLKEDLKDKLQKIADDRKWSLAQLIIDILESYLKGAK